MRKVAFVLAVVFGLGLLGGAAQALDPLCTEAGCAGVDDEGYIVVLDGAIANPDPFDGFIGVNNNGGLDCADHGGPYSPDTDSNGDGVPDHQSGGGCSP